MMDLLNFSSISVSVFRINVVELELLDAAPFPAPLGELGDTGPAALRADDTAELFVDFFSRKSQ
jgi:hypothetical protein